METRFVQLFTINQCEPGFVQYHLVNEASMTRDMENIFVFGDFDLSMGQTADNAAVDKMLEPYTAYTFDPDNPKQPKLPPDAVIVKQIWRNVYA